MTPDRLEDEEIRSRVEHWLLSDKYLTGLLQLMDVWKCKMIFPTGTQQQNIEITDLKPFLAGENTSVPIILTTTVYFEWPEGVS